MMMSCGSYFYLANELKIYFFLRVSAVRALIRKFLDVVSDVEQLKNVGAERAKQQAMHLRP